MAESFNISFVRDKSQVQVKVTPDVTVDSSQWYFTCCLNNAGSPLLAELIVQSLRRSYHDALEAKITAAYQASYRDGRGKKRRKTCFGAHLNPKYIGS